MATIGIAKADRDIAHAGDDTAVPAIDGVMNSRTVGRRVSVQIFRAVRRFGEDESGATAVEYSLILGGVAAAIIVLIYAFGGKVNNLYASTESRWP
jgi:Flp pilus assembly pilin Flp